VFKGLAMGTLGGNNVLYAADFHGGLIRVFNSSFTEITPAGSFMDPKIPKGFAPFNIQNLGGELYVTYAKQKPPDNHDDASGAHRGFVDVFSQDGVLLRRMKTKGPQNPLNSPWGLAIAPSGFGRASGKLLVGDFGDGKINVFNQNTGRFLGQLANRANRPIHIDGLWALTFGNGGSGGLSNVLYFSAGPNGEADGLFGALTVSGNGRLVMP
jgi:uncharacterized protein (TIGR03118 family)